jgi:Fur family ferric uptake transcriptional regulator
VTRVGEHPPRVFEDLDGVVSELRRAGGRLTTTRRVVLEALFAADGPTSAERLADGLDGRFPRLELSSVYRTLEVLEAMGIVRHLHVAHGAGRYALARDPEFEHLVCDRCERVTSVPADRLDAVRAELRAELGFDARFGHFPIHGLCADCAALSP